MLHFCHSLDSGCGGAGCYRIEGEGSEGDVLYQLSPDGVTWYYHDGSLWAEAAARVEANPADEVDAHIGDFAAQAGSGTLHLRIFLAGDGSQAVRLDAVSVEYE